MLYDFKLFETDLRSIRNICMMCALCKSPNFCTPVFSYKSFVLLVRRTLSLDKIKFLLENTHIYKSGGLANLPKIYLTESEMRMNYHSVTNDCDCIIV